MFPQVMARILVIDDDTVVRELTAEILGHNGHTVTQAADGNAGLAAIRSQPPELVITDMEMPGMDGVEMIKILKRELPELPIIAMSGATQSAQYLYLASYLGAERLLNKPFAIGDLLATVNAVLQPPNQG